LTLSAPGKNNGFISMFTKISIYTKVSGNVILYVYVDLTLNKDIDLYCYGNRNSGVVFIQV
jgi:hypothetical protein